MGAGSRAGSGCSKSRSSCRGSGLGASDGFVAAAAATRRASAAYDGAIGAAFVWPRARGLVLAAATAATFAGAARAAALAADGGGTPAQSAAARVGGGAGAVVGGCRIAATVAVVVVMAGWCAS